jgi:hypothetical protein
VGANAGLELVGKPMYEVSPPDRSDSANQLHEVSNLFCDPGPVRTKVLLKANSAKERDDEAGERIIIVTRSTRCRQIVSEQLLGFHYARDHHLAGFWGEVCELAHRIYREAAFLSPTPIADLKKTLNIDPTQRLFRQVSACHQDVEIPAQAFHEQVFFVLEFRIQARFAHTCGLFNILNTRLSEAMLPEDWDCFIEDILSGEQFSSSHRNIIAQFTRGTCK